MKTVSTPTKYYFTIFAAVLLLVLNVYATKAFLIFGSPMLFAIALLVEVVLLVVFLYSLIRSLASPGNILISLARSAWGGLKTNDYLKQFSKSRSPILIWGRRRLNRNSPYGLTLTITFLVIAFFLINFVGLLITVVGKGSLTQIDTRVLNLMPSIRTPDQTNFFRAVTALANPQSTLLLMVATVTVLWRKHNRLLAVLIIVVVVGEETITSIIKTLTHRMRPGLDVRLIRVDSDSFPSGHVVRATVLFGLLAYLVYMSYTSARVKIITIGIYILIVFFVAVSRIYLGVHYPTDVWGSILLGGAMLAAAIGAIEIRNRSGQGGGKKLGLSNRTVPIISGIFGVIALIASPFMVPLQQVMATPSQLILPKIDESSIQRLPLYSETLTGSRMEPINFLYVGYEDQLVNLFKSHGWYRADKSTVSNTLKALAVGFQGRQYLSAPVTPSYLAYKPENIAFQKSTATHSLRQRHHTRLWRTDYALPDGRPIWVATASFDEGIEFVGPAKLPTHHIDPNIDRERIFIINSLGLHSNLIKVVEPQLGKNASGDGFFTDGRAELVFLK